MTVTLRTYTGHYDPPTDDDTDYCPDLIPDDESSEAITAGADESIVDLVVHALETIGAMEPSDCPQWRPGTWYTARRTDYRTGVEYVTTAHLEGLSDDDSRAVYARITGA